MNKEKYIKKVQLLLHRGEVPNLQIVHEKEFKLIINKV